MSKILIPNTVPSNNNFGGETMSKTFPWISFGLSNKKPVPRPVCPPHLFLPR